MSLPLPTLVAVFLGQAALGAAAPGETGLDFLRLDIGPRQVGMGQTGVAVGGDAYGAAYNPALLASLTSRELAVSHVEWLPGIQYQDYLYAHPSRNGNFGLRLQRLDYGDFAGYDARGTRSGDVKASDLLVGLNYARNFYPLGLAVGGAVKLARESIAGVAAQSLVSDVGVTWTPRAGRRLAGATFGLAIRNAGSPSRFEQDSAPSPLVAALGASAPFYHERLIAGVDLHIPAREPARGNLGAEYWASDTVALRAGFELPQAEGPGIRAGVGFRLSSARVDYAFAPMGAFGSTHHVGLSFPFGGASEAAYRQGLSLMREEKYDDAILKFNEALAANPRNVQANRKLRQAYELLKRQYPPEKP